jgi:hypothetical protein
MNIECGDCSDFVELTERRFGELLDRHGFRPVKCSSDRDGRECLLMLESDTGRLLFVRSDGADNCVLGSLEAEFPETGLHEEGESGWYHVISLLQFKTGKKLLTRRRMDKFFEGKGDYFTWQAELFSANAEMLFGLFRGGIEQTWRGEFLQYYRESIKG